MPYTSIILLALQMTLMASVLKPSICFDLLPEAGWQLLLSPGEDTEAGKI